MFYLVKVFKLNKIKQTNLKDCFKSFGEHIY